MAKNIGGYRSTIKCLNTIQFKSQNKIVQDIYVFYLKFKGAVHLPEYHCEDLWRHLLRHPPFIAQPANRPEENYNTNLMAFIVYFSGYWLQQQNLNLVNQFENTGPRTSNLCEGYHLRLKHKFSTFHPELGEFSNFLFPQSNFGKLFACCETATTYT